ncbi:MAG: hypothetical protein ACRDK3_08130 [Actinomycetota bacterium]
MATTEQALSPRLALILDEVARAVGRHGIRQGEASGSKAALRITLENNIRRVVQVYWTAFQANVPGDSIGLHLEVAEPRVHWAEAYLSPHAVNWVFCFSERPTDGEIELSYYREYASHAEAIEGFFNLSSWYVLTATDKTWDDVAYSTADELGWNEQHLAKAGTTTSAAVQEALKKSTILWLRWRHEGRTLQMPVWFLFDNKTSKLYVLSGEREQTLPGASTMREADVILRSKGKDIRIAEITANVRVIPPGEEWDTVAQKVAEKRLNVPGLPEDLADRWRDTCDVLELTLRT